jgi:hypothetical protein
MMSRNSFVQRDEIINAFVSLLLFSFIVTQQAQAVFAQQSDCNYLPQQQHAAGVHGAFHDDAV